MKTSEKIQTMSALEGLPLLHTVVFIHSAQPSLEYAHYGFDHNYNGGPLK